MEGNSQCPTPDKPIDDEDEALQLWHGQGKCGLFLHGCLVEHQVSVGGTAVFVAGVTPVLVGLGARGGEILKR